MNTLEWATLLEECRSSGMSIKSWCEKRGITYRKYLYWTAKLQKQKQWVQVVVEPDAPRIMKENINIHCGKWTVNISEGMSIELISKVIRVVNEICS